MQIHCSKSMTLIILVVLGISVWSAVNSENLDPAISAPWQTSHLVSLTMTKTHLNLTQNCTGAILSDWHILATTQCLIHKNETFLPEEMKVITGPVRVYNECYPTQGQYDVKKIIINHNATHDHQIQDVALLELKSPIEFNKPVGRIGLIELIVTAPTKLGAPKWCKKKVKDNPNQLHLRTGKRNCGGNRVYRGKYIIYVCVKRGKVSTEYCYGVKGTPLLLGDILGGLNIAIP